MPPQMALMSFEFYVVKRINDVSCCYKDIILYVY